MALALPRTSFWPLAWFGLIPMMVAVNSALSLRRTLSIGFIAGWFYHAVVLHWIYQTCRFAHIPIVVSVAVWALLSAVLAINWAIITFLIFYLRRRISQVVRVILWPIAWTAVGGFCALYLPRLGVDVMTYTQGTNLSLLQAGSWGGPFLVGFLVLWINAALAEIWNTQNDVNAGQLTTAMAVTAMVWAHGAYVLVDKPISLGPDASIEILQPNIDQYQKWSERSRDEILKIFDDLLSLPRMSEPKLIVWPETSIPALIPRYVASEQVRGWSKKLHVEQLVGIIATNEEQKGHANGVQQVDANGQVVNFYAKRELVPFGEYVPFRHLVPRFVIDHWLAVLDQMGDLDAGIIDQKLFQTVFGATAITICYEAMFPRWAWRDANRGAKILVNVTNDGWYKDSWGPYQHFAVNALRAIENRQYVIRSGNTGISAVISPWGEVIASLPLNTRGRLDVAVPIEDLYPTRSFYSRHGDWLARSCLLITGFLILLSFKWKT